MSLSDKSSRGELPDSDNNSDKLQTNASELAEGENSHTSASETEENDKATNAAKMTKRGKKKRRSAKTIRQKTKARVAKLRTGDSYRQKEREKDAAKKISYRADDDYIQHKNKQIQESMKRLRTQSSYKLEENEKDKKRKS